MSPIPPETFQWQRGDISQNRGLRLKVRIPDGVLNNKGQQLTVSDIYDTKTKQYIQYGAQLADYITMGVSAVTVEGENAEAKDCVFSADQAKGLAKSVVQTKFKGVNGILWRR